MGNIIFKNFYFYFFMGLFFISFETSLFSEIDNPLDLVEVSHKEVFVGSTVLIKVDVTFKSSTETKGVLVCGVSGRVFGISGGVSTGEAGGELSFYSKRKKTSSKILYMKIGKDRTKVSFKTRVKATKKGLVTLYFDYNRQGTPYYVSLNVVEQIKKKNKLDYFSFH